MGRVSTNLGSCFFFFFNFLFLAVLGLRFCARAFSSCGKRRPLFIAVRGPLTIAASLVRSTGSRRAGSVIVAHGPSCSAACGILLDQGSNPCPLHWQADSQPLRHQGSPQKSFFISEHSTEIFHMDYFPQENCIVLKTPKSLMQSSLSYSYFRNVLNFLLLIRFPSFLICDSTCEATDLTILF